MMLKDLPIKQDLLNCDLFVGMQEQTHRIQQEIINSAVIEFEQKRIEVITKRLGQLGIKFDINEQKNKRFKDIVTESIGNETTIWYRDGSETGLRIVTFVDVMSGSEPVIRTGCNTLEITQQYKYY